MKEEEKASQKAFSPEVAEAEMRKAGVGAPLPDGISHHFFLSHYQATGGDQVDSLHHELKDRGFSCWYDNRMANLTKQALCVASKTVSSICSRRTIIQA